MTFNESLKQHRLQLLLLLPLLAWMYYKIVPDMVRDWYKDENYSHGFLVPFIAGYFIWQRWPDLKERLVKPDGWGLFVILCGLLQLLVAWLGTEYFTMRSSIIVILAGVTLFWFGREVLKGMSLPLGYLIFMVPIPYIIYDMVAFPLKLFVTKVSVAFLKLVGVVVMREGNIIMFTSTTFEVADACSGIRSLISLLAIAVAYAFVIKTSNLRRWIIIISAIPIAVATNALRVIVTGILAQWWGAGAAEGFFHEFAGMAVFLLAMVILVAVGVLVKGKCGEEVKGASDLGTSTHSPITDHPSPDSKPSHITDHPSPDSNASLDVPITHHTSHITALPITALPLPRFIAVIVLFAATALIITFHRDTTVPTARPLSEFPQQVKSWQMTSNTEFSADVLGVLKPTDYLYRQYKDTNGKTVQIYIGYHGGGKDSGGIHSPKHCLPGSGWYEVSTRRGALETPGGRINLVRAVYQKGDSKELFLYWFQVRDHSISDEYSLKMSEILNSALYRRRDASFIRVSLPVDTDVEQSALKGEQFIRDFEPLIREYLPR